MTWWSLATGTLTPNALGWWYKVSDSIRFKECRSFAKRIGEDVEIGHKPLGIMSCPKCPVGKSKYNHSVCRKQHGVDQTGKDKTTEVRQSLCLRTPIQSENRYCELDEDECMNSDGDLALLITQ